MITNDAKYYFYKHNFTSCLFYKIVGTQEGEMLQYHSMYISLCPEAVDCLTTSKHYHLFHPQAVLRSQLFALFDSVSQG